MFKSLDMQEVGNMTVKMQSLEKYLESIANIFDLRRHRDCLIDVSIQIQRGLEYYERKVTLGNILNLYNPGFENQVKSCQDQISVSIEVMKETKKTPKSFGLCAVESWILSSDDVVFDPINLSTDVGRGGYATVFWECTMDKPWLSSIFIQYCLQIQLSWKTL